MDGRVRHQDLAARHFVPNPITRPDLRDLKNRDNKLAQQMRRWRERWCCVSWASRRTGTDVFLNYIDNLLPQELKDRNTTRGWRKLYRDEVAEVKGMNVGNFPNRSATKDLSKRQKYIDAETRKRERLMELARKRRALEAQGIRPSESEHESEEEQQTASEGEEDDESKGPDSRRDRPATAEEEQELHEAMLPTILHFLNLTGELPVVDSWSRRYLLIHWDLHWQLQIALGRSDRQRVPSLVGYGRWTGGISGWRTATLITDPTKD
ncbi:MAG: hypothetical protein LQ346_008032 [Caloplaca aetnensis]|nr:MAG: hypothetical protein LQ346_008032 [Caloplaca aetnensis]